MNVQELCWVLSECNFPSIQSGEEFISWCANKGIDILIQDNETIVSEFKLFVKSRIERTLGPRNKAKP